MDIYFDPNSIGPVKPADGEKGVGKPRNAQTGKGDFAAVLREVTAERPLQFSAHALRRLSSRGLEPGADVLEKLNSAVEKAEAKGSRDSLVLIDKLAFIVAVKNKTVVTAFDIEEMEDNVVTNIDSAVIS